MLDEMTAALPANLTERVLEVVGRQRGGERCVVFISHRMIEIAAVCDRATVLREGETVGVVDVTAGSEDRIVELMLGQTVEAMAAGERRARPNRDGVTPRLSARGLRHGTRLEDATFELHPGEVLGVVALEGQGQDELFDILAGHERPSGGELLVDGQSTSFRHPADAIRAGLVYVAADRAEALADAAVRAREHRAAVHDQGLHAGARSTWATSGAASRRRSSGSRSTPAPRARCAACRVATSRR